MCGRSSKLFSRGTTRRPCLIGRLLGTWCRSHRGCISIDSVGISIRLIDRRVAEDAIAEAGRVPQQITNRDGAGSGRLLDGHLARLSVDRVRLDLHLCELGQELGDGVVEEEVPFFQEHHDRDGRDGLGHRVDAEDGIVGHRLTGFAVPVAPRLNVGDLASPRDECDSSGGFLSIDVPLDVGVDAAQSTERQPDLLWRDSRKCRGMGDLFRGNAGARLSEQGAAE